MWRLLPSLEEIKRLFNHNYVDEIFQEKGAASSQNAPVPYQQITLSQEDKKNLSRLLKGLSQNNIFFIAMDRLEIELAGKALWGLPVLKILEEALLHPERKAQMQIIFNYSQYEKAWLPTSFLLAAVKNQLFEGLGRYLEEHPLETQSHLPDFAQAVGREAFLPRLKELVEKKNWDCFFDLLLA
ncbi:MAG: hypothetical protein WC371_05710 [Parachlamydiales bacterium]